MLTQQSHQVRGKNSIVDFGCMIYSALSYAVLVFSLPRIEDDISKESRESDYKNQSGQLLFK